MKRPVLKLTRKHGLLVIEQPDDALGGFLYLKCLLAESAYRGFFKPGRYRIVTSPTARFGFCRDTDKDGNLAFQLYDHQRKRLVDGVSGGGWCAYEVRALKLVTVRFTLRRVRGYRDQ